MTDANCQKLARYLFYAALGWMADGDPWITDVYRINFWGMEPSGLFDSDGNEVMKPVSGGGAPLSLLLTMLIVFWMAARKEVKPVVKKAWAETAIQALKFGRELIQRVKGPDLCEARRTKEIDGAAQSKG